MQTKAFACNSQGSCTRGRVGVKPCRQGGKQCPLWRAGGPGQLGTFKQGVSKQWVTTFITILRCRCDARCRQCTGKRLSRTTSSSFNKERMLHLCDSTVAGPTARRDSVLASKCEYPPFRYTHFKFARTEQSQSLAILQSQGAIVENSCRENQTTQRTPPY